MSVLLDLLGEKKHAGPRGSLQIEGKKEPSLGGFWFALFFAFVFSLAASGATVYLYTLFTAQEENQATLEATYVQVSEKVKALEEALGQIQTEAQGIRRELRQQGGETSLLKREFEGNRQQIAGFEEKLGSLEASSQALKAELENIQARQNPLA